MQIAVQELLPPKPLASLTQGQLIPPVASASITPMSPNFPPAFQTSPVPQEILSQWAETAAMMISSPMTTETSAALTALGDQLAANGWVEASHAWYVTETFIPDKSLTSLAVTCSLLKPPLLAVRVQHLQESHCLVERAPLSARAFGRILIRLSSLRLLSSLCRWLRQRKDRRSSPGCPICSHTDLSEQRPLLRWVMYKLPRGKLISDNA